MSVDNNYYNILKTRANTIYPSTYCECQLAINYSLAQMKYTSFSVDHYRRKAEKFSLLYQKMCWRLMAHPGDEILMHTLYVKDPYMKNENNKGCTTTLMPRLYPACMKDFFGPKRIDVSFKPRC